MTSVHQRFSYRSWSSHRVPGLDYCGGPTRSNFIWARDCYASSSLSASIPRNILMTVISLSQDTRRRPRRFHWTHRRYTSSTDRRCDVWPRSGRRELNHSLALRKPMAHRGDDRTTRHSSTTPRRVKTSHYESRPQLDHGRCPDDLVRRSLKLRVALPEHLDRTCISTPSPPCNARPVAVRSAMRERFQFCAASLSIAVLAN